MQFKYFVYDPDKGFLRYETDEEAEHSYKSIITEKVKQILIDGWDDFDDYKNITDICWGEIKQETNKFIVKKSSPNNGTLYSWEFEAVDVE